MFYFENPLYAPIVIKPVPRNGQLFASQIGDGIIVQPYTWIRIPLDITEDVIYQCDVYHSILGIRGAAGNNAKGWFYQLDTPGYGGGENYPIGKNPVPRMARYFFANSMDNGVAKGSLLRDSPTQQGYNVCVIGTPITGVLALVPFPVGTGSPVIQVSSVGRLTGQTLSADFYGSMNDLVGRTVITGVSNSILQKLGASKNSGFRDCVIWFDEILDINAGRYYQDIICDVQNSDWGRGATQMRNAQISDIYDPVPGARSLTYFGNGSIASPTNSLVDQSLKVYFSEF